MKFVLMGLLFAFWGKANLLEKLQSCKTNYDIQCALLEVQIKKAMPQVSSNKCNEEPVGGSGVSYYYSDDCSSRLIGVVGDATNCNNLNMSGSVWGVRIGGKCHNISDTDAQTACRSYNSSEVQIYYSDDCSSRLEASIGAQTDCDSVRGTAWGVSFNGSNTCHNISDTTAAEACRRFRGSDVQFFYSDDCSSRLVGSISPGADCSQMPSGPVWGVKINGVCENISDTDMMSACRQFGGN